MAKNMTRKGLAFAAAGALMTSALVSAPAALAAGEVTLAPTAGTSLNILTLDNFELTTALSSSVPVGNIVQLKYQVKRVSGDTAIDASATSDGTYPSSSTGFNQTTTSETTEVFAPEATSTTAANKIQLTLNSADNDSLESKVEVTAFLDANGNSIVDSGEYQATTTVTFVKPSSVVPTVTLTQPYVSESSLVAVVDADLNYQQTTALKVAFYVDGSKPTTEYGNATPADGTTRNATYAAEVAGAYDSTTTSTYYTKFTASYAKPNLTTMEQSTTDQSAGTLDPGSAAFAVATAKVYGAQVEIGGVAIGSLVTKSVSESALAYIETTVDGSDLALTSTTGKASAVNGGAANGAAIVRQDATSFKVNALFKDGVAATDDPIAGLPVVVTVTDTNVDTADLIYVNGKAVAASVTLNLVTDANGEVSVDVTAAGDLKTDADDVLIFNFAAQGKTTAAAVADANFNGGTMTVNFDPAAYTVVDMNDTDDNGQYSIAAKGSFTLNYQVVDQWGQAPADNKYRIAITQSGDNRSTAATWAYYPVVLGGTVSQTVVDDGSIGTDSSIAVVANLETYPAGANVVTATDEAFNLNIVADATPGLLTLNNSTSTPKYIVEGSVQDTRYGVDTYYNTNLKALSSVDSRVQPAATFPTLTANQALEINGVVKTAAGAVIPGALVTVSGSADLYFQSATANATTSSLGTGINTIKSGSLSQMAESTGEFAFHIYTNKAGTYDVTITSGSQTKTVSMTFKAGTEDAGTSLVIDAASSVSAGSTVSVSVLLTDVYGNPVDTDLNGQSGAQTLSVTATGAGFTFPSTIPTNFDDGKISFAVILGSNDTGTIVVTAKYDADGTGTASAQIAATKTITIGTAGNVGALASWTKNLNDGTVKMYAKNIVGAGKVQFMLNGEEIAWVRATSAADSKLRSANGASYLVRTVDLVEGQKNVLEIYVDGVRTTRTAYTY